MIRWIVGVSLRSRGLVLALAVGVLALGFVELDNMPRDVLPEFSPVTVEVQTEALGLSAPEVEQLITVPLEQDLLNGVAFLDFIRSESVPGLSRIQMIFEPGTPLGDARQVVNERLTQAVALPHVSKPPQMLQPVSSAGRVMMIGLSSENLSLIDLSLLARWTIRPQLLGVPGVANVSIWGQREQQLQVQVDPARLRDQGVTLEQVLRTTGNALWVSPLSFLEASTPGTGGFFDTATQRIGVQHVQPITSPADLAKVPLEGLPGASSPVANSPLRLGDVASVVTDNQPLIGDAVFTDQPGLMLVVEKLPEANTLEVTEDLDSAMDELQPGLAGVSVDSSFFRPARYIETSSDNLRTALLVGLALLVIALAVLLFDWRLAVVSVASVAVSLAAAIIVLAGSGQTINPMVLAGLLLALVVVIDDVVASSRSTRRGLDATEPTGAGQPFIGRLAEAIVETRGPLAYGTAILLVALVPVFALHGELGAFLPPLVLAYAAAVVASTLVALTVAPVLTTLLLPSEPTVGRESSMLAGLGVRYHSKLDRFLRYGRYEHATGHRQRNRHRMVPRPEYVAVGALLVLGAALVPLLDRGDSLVPAFKDRDVLIHWDGAPGTSLPEMSRITARAGRELRELPGVANVGAHVGRAVAADQIVGVNSSEMWVSIAASADYDRTVSSIREVVGGYPGIESSVLTYGQDRINDLLVEADGVNGKDLTVRVFGQDLDTLRAQADLVKKAADEIAGVDNSKLELYLEEPTLEVEVDLDRAQALGIKPGDVRRTAATLLAGIEVGNLFEDQKVFEVVVRGVAATRHSINSIGQLLVETQDGAPVPLQDVADVRIVASPNVIRHQDVSRSMDIGIDVAGRDIDAVAGDIQAQIRSMEFPLEYHAEVLGEYADRQAERVNFIGVAIASLIGIFLLLQASFQSWRMASVAFVVLVASLTGGILAALIDGGQISIGTLVGFFAVFGLSARKTVLFVRRCQMLEDRKGEPFGQTLVERVAQERLAPTVMSAVLVATVFVPLLFFGGMAGHEILHPMAAVVLGGLVTSTLLHLFALPALYLRFGLRPDDSRESFELALDRGAPGADSAPL